ncbi:hypothetical protein [Acidithiobacillus sp.]
MASLLTAKIAPMPDAQKKGPEGPRGSIPTSGKTFSCIEIGDASQADVNQWQEKNHTFQTHHHPPFAQ